MIADIRLIERSLIADPGDEYAQQRYKHLVARHNRPELPLFASNKEIYQIKAIAKTWKLTHKGIEQNLYLIETKGNRFFLLFEDADGIEKIYNNLVHKIPDFRIYKKDYFKFVSPANISCQCHISHHDLQQTARSYGLDLNTKDDLETVFDLHVEIYYGQGVDKFVFADVGSYWCVDKIVDQKYASITEAIKAYINRHLKKDPLTFDEFNILETWKLFKSKRFVISMINDCALDQFSGNGPIFACPVHTENAIKIINQEYHG